MLRYHSTTTYVQTTIADTGQNKSIIYVRTDSRGDAKVYLVPSTSAGTDPVMYVPVNLSADGSSEAGVSSVTSDPDFTATATPAIRTGADQTVDRGSSTLTPEVNARVGTQNQPLEMRLALTSNTANVQIHFEVTGGRIYLDPRLHDQINPDYKTSLTTVTSSGGVATVLVQVNNGATARVTGRIAGNNTHTGRHTVTYFWDYPHIEYVSGSEKKFGATGGRLEEPLVVRVKDGPNGSPVPGQVVKFKETSTASQTWT